MLNEMLSRYGNYFNDIAVTDLKMRVLFFKAKLSENFIHSSGCENEVNLKLVMLE